MTEDTELMLRVKKGDEAAFREIVERYQGVILNLCFRYVGNQEDAEEVTQDVFVQLYRAARRYQPKAKFFTYLYRIAVNLSLNRIRQQKRKQWISLDHIKSKRGEEPVLPATENPDSLLEREEKQRIVQKAINALPVQQRTAVILKRYQGLSYEEIAEVMQSSVSAVEARLHRARQNLEKQLRPLIS